LSGNTFMRVLTEGTRLADRYTLIRRLGRGGMAEIWLAADSRNNSRNNSRNDSRVALKFLHAELAGDDRRRELFHSEWRQASRLMHAHIVRSFEYHGEADGPYFALQYLDGPDIGELAGNCGRSVCWPMRCAMHTTKVSCTVTSRRAMSCLMAAGHRI
jgi:serine/threonine protein kinase